MFLVLEIKRNEDHDTFINAVTHELKTPIASIRLYLETLQARECRRPAAAGVLRRHAGGRGAPAPHCRSGVESAGVAREKRRRADQAPLDIGLLARECVDLRRDAPPSATAERSPLEAHDGASLIVSGDAEELRTVITNLLDNAVKYSGTTSASPCQLAAPSPDTIWVRVQDRGVGIPRKQLKRIFNRFYRVQTRGIRQVKGTGLGLYIVRAIAAPTAAASSRRAKARDRAPRSPWNCPAPQS